jgi:hypothetical protein
MLTLSARENLEPTVATTPITHALAPKYSTRSRTTPQSQPEAFHPGSETSEMHDETARDETNGFSSDYYNDIAPTTPSSSSDRATIESVLVPEPSRKRGRHKEYVAPTGVWKTNGGYISTIYVGNRRIYGPLRVTPAEAGKDRERLTEAKAYVKNEAEMRNFILSLKSSKDIDIVNTLAVLSSNNSIVPMVPTRAVKKRKIAPKKQLTTITSTTVSINNSFFENQITKVE